MSVVLLTRAAFCVVLFRVICVFCCLVVLIRLSITSPSDWLTRLVSEMTYNVLVGMLNPANSLTHFSVNQNPFICEIFKSERLEIL